MAKVNVFFDGGCPLCKREVNLYSKLDKDNEICWVNVAEEEFSAPENYTKNILLSRFHARDVDGQYYSGAKAFFLVWSKLRGWKTLAKLGRFKLVVWIAEYLYKFFLIVRPFIQAPFALYDRLFVKLKRD